MSKHPRQTYKTIGAATWELIRAGYLAGESAPSLAARYGTTEHAIRKRIYIEKWTKRDYAAALEARGLSPPRRAKPMNVAEHFAALQAPLSAAASPAPETFTDAADIARAPLEQAEDLERRALAQAAAAVLCGKASDAKALGALAEQMRKRVADEKEAAAEAARVAAAQVTRERQNEEERLVGNLRAALKLAYCMVHNAQAAPAIYLDSVARVRREAFGEGTEESIERAYEEAQRARAYFGLDEAAWEAAWDAIVGEGAEDSADLSSPPRGGEGGA